MDPSNVESSQYCIVCGRRSTQVMGKYAKDVCEDIAILALEVFSIPAMSAPIERIFSQAGLASSKHRNRTSFDLLNSPLVVYCNVYSKNL
uniref:HAT C-terminal dimerisation domain-containing protein n=1 Tax=Ditylenchus dipsaci TaxID=166011 RepID=A0A915EK73_9BILA